MRRLPTLATLLVVPLGCSRPGPAGGGLYVTPGEEGGYAVLGYFD